MLWLGSTAVRTDPLLPQEKSDTSPYMVIIESAAVMAKLLGVLPSYQSVPISTICFEVELYRFSAFDFQPDISIHIYAFATTDVATCRSGYVGIVSRKTHLPVFIGGVALVCGNDGSKLRRSDVV